MIKINWQVRLRNKTWLTTFVIAIVAFIYQILAMLGVTAPISESDITEVIMALINVATILGILIDPTTSGASDTTRALGYTEPAPNCKVAVEPTDEEIQNQII